MQRPLAVASVLLAASLTLTACGGITPRSKAAPTPHTPADGTACAALDAIFVTAAEGQQNSEAQGQALIAAGSSAASTALRTDAATLRSAAARGDLASFQKTVAAMAVTCDAMGIGPVP